MAVHHAALGVESFGRRAGGEVLDHLRGPVCGQDLRAEPCGRKGEPARPGGDVEGVVDVAGDRLLGQAASGVVPAGLVRSASTPPPSGAATSARSGRAPGPPAAGTGPIGARATPATTVDPPGTKTYASARGIRALAASWPASCAAGCGSPAGRPPSSVRHWPGSWWPSRSTTCCCVGRSHKPRADVRRRHIAANQYSSAQLAVVRGRPIPLRGGRPAAVRRRARQRRAAARAGPPRLVVYGESLGSQGSEAAFTTLADIRAQADGVLWVGPPIRPRPTPCSTVPRWASPITGSQSPSRQEPLGVAPIPALPAPGPTPTQRPGREPARRRRSTQPATTTPPTTGPSTTQFVREKTGPAAARN